MDRHRALGIAAIELVRAVAEREIGRARDIAGRHRAAFLVGALDGLVGERRELRDADQPRARGDAHGVERRRDRRALGHRAVQVCEGELDLRRADAEIARHRPACGHQVPFAGLEPVLRLLPVVGDAHGRGVAVVAGRMLGRERCR